MVSGLCCECICRSFGVVTKGSEWEYGCSVLSKIGDGDGGSTAGLVIIISM